MHAAHVAGVAAVATAVLDRGGLENGYRHAGFPRHQGCAQRGIATSNNRDIRLDDSFNHAMQSYIISSNWRGRIAWHKNGISSAGNSFKAARRRGGSDRPAGDRRRAAVFPHSYSEEKAVKRRSPSPGGPWRTSVWPDVADLGICVGVIKIPN